MQLVAATNNRDKLAEFRRILAPLGVEVLSPGELGLHVDVEENGDTFAENARTKAEAFFRASGKPAVADDSGLCVDAMEGRPGVLSARYHGEDTPYPQKMNALLAELEGVPPEGRTARFVSAICCVLEEDTTVACQESCEGSIGFAPAGGGGFGYDPLFYVGERSFAQLSGAEKDAVSHRGKALRSFVQKLEQELKAREEL